MTKNILSKITIFRQKKQTGTFGETEDEIGLNYLTMGCQKLLFLLVERTFPSFSIRFDEAGKIRKQ